MDSNGSQKMGWYDAAQICLNGHVINHCVKKQPESNKEFCDKCGAATITNCQNCNTEIQGHYHSKEFFAITYAAPAFCPKCGEPYPWTEAKIRAAQDLAKELDNISDEEQELLALSIDEIITDTPRTTVAATRLKKILLKVGKPIADAFRDILVDVASETAKKVLWPQ
jgi:hypothetical protein